VTTPVQRTNDDPANVEFFPKGAIAFFVAMIAGYGVIWLAIYLLLVQRQLWL